MNAHPSRRLRPASGSALLVLLCGFALTGGPGEVPVRATAERRPPAAQRLRTVHATVLTDKGAPVDGLSSADLVVQEDGRTCRIVDVKPATAPLSVALLLDDRGSDINEIRTGLAGFAARIEGQAEISLVTVVPTTTTVFDYTSDPRAVVDGIRRLVWRAGQAGGLVLGAIADTADALTRRESPRSAIVVVTFEGDEFKSHRRARDVLAALEKSRAALYVIAVGKPTMRRMNRAQVESGDVQGDEWTVDEGNRNAVLGEGPRLSGGRRHELTAATGLSRALVSVAADLMNQYTIVYESANEPSPGASRKFGVSVKRRGITLRAPNRIPG